MLAQICSFFFFFIFFFFIFFFFATERVTLTPPLSTKQIKNQTNSEERGAGYLKNSRWNEEERRGKEQRKRRKKQRNEGDPESACFSYQNLRNQVRA